MSDKSLDKLQTALAAAANGLQAALRLMIKHLVPESEPKRLAAENGFEAARQAAAAKRPTRQDLVLAKAALGQAVTTLAFLGLDKREGAEVVTAAYQATIETLLNDITEGRPSRARSPKPEPAEPPADETQPPTD